MGTMIKFLIYAIAMNVIYFAINSLYNRKNILSGSDQNGSCYIVKMPKALKYVYTAFFCLGLFMFCVFFTFKILENPTVTKGHLWMCLGIMAIGLLGVFWASRWKIAVNGDQMEIQRLLRKNIIIQIDEIERVKIGKKNQMVLYRNGKMLITIDYLSDNFELLEQSLKRHGKIGKS